MKPVRLWTVTLLTAFGLLLALGSLLLAMVYFSHKGTSRDTSSAAGWQQRLVKLGAEAGYRISPPEKKMIYEGGGAALESWRFTAAHDEALPGGSTLTVAYVPQLTEYRVDFTHGGTLAFAHFTYDPATREVQLRAEKNSLSDVDVEAAVANSPLTRRQVEEQIAAVFDLVKRAGGP